MPLYTDELGRSLELPHTPVKIISLVPSQTELLHDLGLEKEVAGITKFCVHPHHWLQHKTRVGGTKNVDMKMIQTIQPDLIIANKEENDRAQIEQLARNYPVWISDISTIEDALNMIESIGAITDKNHEAKKIIETIKNKFDELATHLAKTKEQKKISVAYLIWRKPYMAAGGDTFIHEMMSRCGFENIFDKNIRYPEINIEQLKMQPGNEPGGCQLLLLSSEPFPFKEKHIRELQPDLPGTKIILVDGEMFSWYGSRLLHAPDYFRTLLKEIQ
jgi:ABC-type Fe3+-hydroxamate transport system substrate-binding protein